MVATLVLEASAERRAGSSPVPGTTFSFSPSSPWHRFLLFWLVDGHRLIGDEKVLFICLGHVATYEPNPLRGSVGLRLSSMKAFSLRLWPQGTDNARLRRCGGRW